MLIGVQVIIILMVRPGDQLQLRELKVSALAGHLMHLMVKTVNLWFLMILHMGQLRYMIRDTKGTGTWSETVFEAPVDQKISWPRATTSGINHNVIQMLAITWPVANTGTIYQGLDGALLYSRSTDGGSTWDPQNVILEWT